jgi:hypothetical protein
MSLPVTFEPHDDGREVAKLGAIMIGEVAPNPGGKRVPFWARITLPDVTTRPIPATSMDHGRQLVRNAVDAWIAAAGLRA